jgi:hypothetical protein
MKKIIIFTKEFVFGVRREPVESISTSFKTLKPKNQPSYQEWVKEFNVSMLHDRKITFLN